MSNPKNESEKIQNLISDVRSQLINIEASMELASIAANTTEPDASAFEAFIDLLKPLISDAASKLDTVSTMLHKDSQNEENA